MNLTFGEKIKAARKLKGLTQKQLAEKIDAKHNSVSDWENNKNKPDPDTIELLCGVLDIAPNYLLAVGADEFSPAEKLLIKKYRDLDEAGRKHVDTVILWESERIQAAASTGPSKIAPLPTRIISYYQRLASAGTGEYLFSGIPTDTIEVPITPVSELADFAIGVNGDSMEPTYYDGDKVYVEELGADELSVGEIGIFMIDNECYIKEVGDGKLISHNKKYHAIEDERNVRAIGRVLGKVEEN